MRQRDNCQTCLASILRVWIDGKPVVCDWPRHEHGDVAVEHCLNGNWLARHLPVGAPLMPTEHRFRRHDCGEAKPDLSEPVRAAEGLRGDDFKAAMKAERSRQARDKRNQSHKRPGNPITGVRINPR